MLAANQRPVGAATRRARPNGAGGLPGGTADLCQRFHLEADLIEPSEIAP